MNKQVEKAYFEQLLKGFKKSNQARKDRLAKEAGYKSAAEYLAILQKKAGTAPAKAIKNDNPKKAPKKKPAHVASGGGEPITQSPETSSVPVPPAKKVVHNVHILDVSGSMSHQNKIKYALQGINAEVETLKQDDTVTYTHTFVHFSYHSDIRTDYFKKPIADVKPVSMGTRGSTALLDAIGHTLTRLSNETPADEKVLVKIFTDGDENASVAYTWAKIKSLKTELEKRGFTITFVGTEADVKTIQSLLNLDASNTLIHDNTAKGVQESFTRSTTATLNYSKKVAAGQDVLTGFYTKRTGKL